MKNKIKEVYKHLVNQLPFRELSQELSGGVAGQEAELISLNMPPLLRQAAAEGSVLLKNDGTLPFKADTTLSVFGRAQINYFYAGYGSGGDVLRPYQIGLLDGLRHCPDLQINTRLAELYEEWCEEPAHRPRKGGWGRWPRHHPEMPLSEEDIALAAAESEAALVVIGRGAGESRDAVLKPGSYYLTNAELKLLELVTGRFKKVVVVVNSGYILDLSWAYSYGDKINAVLLAWHGGMESGYAVADILSGYVNPSGRLTDTIARHYGDYPSANDFGSHRYNNYSEDIFVGYRYFETFLQRTVLFPFGYGLSYTTFRMSLMRSSRQGRYLIFVADVQNTGRVPGKEVVQLYAAAPQGKLGKPRRVLIGFAKTRLLSTGEHQEVALTATLKELASFDDSGKSGYQYSFVLEQGDYTFYLGGNVRDAKPVWQMRITETLLLERLEPVMALDSESFARLAVGEISDLDCKKMREAVPTARYSLHDRICDRLPRPLHPKSDKGITLGQVQRGEHTLQAFVAQLSDKELEVLSRGAGPMNSELGPKGNAGVFGGVTKALQKRGIPPVTAVDGPSGIRLRRACSLLPCATTLACTWDIPLVEQLHQELGSELKRSGAHMLLSPGMNIHRNPLCGRNFEYYSEDPLLSGRMGAAVVRGLQSQGVAACPKHIACNQQEHNRNHHDSRVSQRALREIYLRGFEICVKESSPISVMSSYNKVNGVWSHYNYDLFTTILRGEWGFSGVVLTDWWIRYAKSPEFEGMRNDAYRIRAQVDILMPGGKSILSSSAHADQAISKSLQMVDGLTRAELQRGAINILGAILRLGLAADAVPGPDED